MWLLRQFERIRAYSHSISANGGEKWTQNGRIQIRAPLWRRKEIIIQYEIEDNNHWAAGRLAEEQERSLNLRNTK